MNLRDPKLIVLQFDEYINNQDIKGLTSLMTEDHIFIDRDGNKFADMVNGWKEFFENYPTYTNYFYRVESRENLVILISYIRRSCETSEQDHAIWKAIIEGDCLSKWKIYEDPEENRLKLNTL
jgi:ketosteroid isomerase-like protein